MNNPETLKALEEKLGEKPPISEMDWQENFYESNWKPDTFEYTEEEKKWVEELGYFLPRHMQVYDWNLPYIDYILLVTRKHLTKPKITLARVLYKILEHFKNQVTSGGDYTPEQKASARTIRLIQRWDITRPDDLRHQSPECIAFLASIFLTDEER